MAAACALVAAAGPAPALAQAPDLLENERAFAFAARATDPMTIEVRFVIAPGYYLYRDKLRFDIQPGVVRAPPVLPRGEMKHDEFFGDSETYRRTLLVRLAADGMKPGQSVTVAAESQGCADLGVCYPPQRQQVVVAVPKAGAVAGAFVEAAPAKHGWFQ